MKALILADIDDLYWKHGLGQAEVLLSCGDIANQVIIEASIAYECQVVFAVKGNHDPSDPFPCPIVDLHCKIQEYNGLRFVGFNGAWKYKPKGDFLYEQWEVEDILSSIPTVDIFLSHNSPRGIHDQDDGVHLGFEGFNTYMNHAKPKLFVHGHQHINSETAISGRRVIGVYGWQVIDIQ